MEYPRVLRIVSGTKQLGFSRDGGIFVSQESIHLFFDVEVRMPDSRNGIVQKNIRIGEHDVSRQSIRRHERKHVRIKESMTQHDLFDFPGGVRHAEFRLAIQHFIQ